MNIVIVGQGAIGLLWYCQLYKSLKLKNQQTLLNISLRPSIISSEIPETVNFTHRNNFREDFPLNIANHRELAIADVFLICVKSYHVKQAVLSITPFIKSTASIILSHNGMGTVDELPANLTDNHEILALLMTHGSLKTQAWQIKHTGQGSCDLGYLTDLRSSSIKVQRENAPKRMDAIQFTQVLNNALPNVIFQKNMIEKQWLKLAINCVINPLTAIHNIENGKILSVDFVDLIADILDEVVIIAGYQQVILDPKMLTHKVLEVAKATEQNHSSMLCDVQAQRKTEIDYINGYIDRLGKIFNYPTPVNTALYLKVLQLPHS